MNATKLITRLPKSQVTTQKIIAAALLLFTFQCFGQEFAHGHNALEIFDEQGMANTPQWVVYWMYFMGFSFVLGLLFVKNHSIARWVVGCFIAGILFMTAIAPALGIRPLSGFIALCHLVFWSPPLYFLLKSRPFLDSNTPYAMWTGLITGVILFSFIFDIRDAAIYLHHILSR